MNENDNFEKLMHRLEEIVYSMEKNDLTLDEQIALFQEGVSCSKKCSELLNEAELKIKEMKVSDGILSFETVEEENL